MKPIPWKYIKSWKCIACGACCKGFDVVLGYKEWVDIIRRYGIEVTQPGITKLYLRKRSDGSCVFLTKFYDLWLCALQHTKPRACKLWPFKIYSEPMYGLPNQAFWDLNGKRIFVYVDPSCMGITWGNPTQEFVYRTLKEFVEIGLGLREKQFYTTAELENRIFSQGHFILKRDFRRIV